MVTRNRSLPVLSLIGLTGVLLLFCQAAEAQYSTGFELLDSLPDGEPLNGQDSFYLPAAGGTSAEVYPYVGNTLNISANPTGGDQFVAGIGPGGGTFSRSQRDITYSGTGIWTVSFDLNVTFQSFGASAQNIGSLSTQEFPVGATFIALARWVNTALPNEGWNADYVWFDAAGTQLTEQVDHPGFQNLTNNNWYRWSTTFSFDTNRILQVTLTDITGGGPTLVHCPADRYLLGGAAGGAPTPNGFRLFSGAVNNTMSWDNIDIDECTDCCEFITDLTCDVAFPDVSLSWTNNAAYTSLVVDRDGTVILDDPTGTATGVTDLGAPAGVSTYTVTGTCPVSGLTFECTCTVTISPPPPNDDCADAIVVLDGDTAFTTENATDDGPQNCAGAFGSDIWFDYTATSTGTLQLSTCGQANYDTAIAIYSNLDCPAGTGTSVSLGCNDDGGGCAGFTSFLTISATMGEQYKIQLGGFNGEAGSGTLTISIVPPPGNNDCANAADLTGPLPLTVEGENITATDSGADMACGTDDSGDVWYTFTPANDILLEADTCQSTDPNVDTALQIWDAGADCAAILGGAAGGTCNDDACGPGPGFASQVSVVATAGVQYIISVEGWGGTGYAFSLRLDAGIPPAPPEPCNFADPEIVSMTQSVSQAVVAANSVACNAGGVTSDNGYIRIFDFGLQGISGTIEIHAVEIGIEIATAGVGADTQPVNMIINDFSGVYVPGGPIPAGTLTPVGSENHGLPTLAGSGVQCFPFTTPIVVNTGVIDDIAVEVDIPDATAGGPPHSFFIGSNPDGESRQSYLRSVGCASPEPVPVASLGFPGMHIVMNVHYKPSANPGYLRGDCDGNGLLNALVDALFLLAFGFQGGTAPPCMDGADVDGDGVLNALVDVLYLLAFGFQGGNPPPAPFPNCAPGAEVVGCATPTC